MCLSLDPFRLLLIPLVGCLNQHQHEVIDYLQEEMVFVLSFHCLSCFAHSTGQNDSLPMTAEIETMPNGRITEDESGADRGGPIQCRHQLGSSQQESPVRQTRTLGLRWRKMETRCEAMAPVPDPSGSPWDEKMLVHSRRRDKTCHEGLAFL